MSTSLPVAPPTLRAHSPFVISRTPIVGGHATACHCGWGTWYPTMRQAAQAVIDHRAEVGA